MMTAQQNQPKRRKPEENKKNARDSLMFYRISLYICGVHRITIGETVTKWLSF